MGVGPDSQNRYQVRGWALCRPFGTTLQYQAWNEESASPEGLAEGVRVNI